MRWLLAVLLAAPLTSQAQSLTGRVIAVLDGDTLDILIHEQTQPTPIRVRLAEIDAPEKGQPFGQASKESLDRLCFDKPAVTLITDIDRFNRVVGRVYCDGVDANAVQIDRGMAWFFVRYGHDIFLQSAEFKAREDRVGLWRDPGPVAPWAWRRGGERRWTCGLSC